LTSSLTKTFFLDNPNFFGYILLTALYPMKKEVLVAIITGFALGLLITFGVWTANRAIQKTPAEPASPSPTPEIIITPQAESSEISLTVLSPEDNFLSDEEEIAVSGKTAPQAVVVILYQEGEKILEADQNGDFSTTITLAGGDNQIEVAAYDEAGSEIKKSLTVVYSTAEI